jgi:hypothetical protein
MFADVGESAGVGRAWAPGDLRHTYVSLLSDDGMAIEKIARLAGHASSHVTETVYGQELRRRGGCFFLLGVPGVQDALVADDEQRRG